MTATLTLLLSSMCTTKADRAVSDLSRSHPAAAAVGLGCLGLWKKACLTETGYLAISLSGRAQHSVALQFASCSSALA
jgi:hypothetical protein